MTMISEGKSRSNLVELIRTTLLGGFLVVMPAYLAILAFEKMLKGLISLVIGLLEPIAVVLGIDKQAFAIPVSLFIFFLICLIAGILVKTSYSRIIQRTIEPVLKKIPGYLLIRRLTNRIARLEKTDTLDTLSVGFVALGETYESLSPAFLIEKHENGMHTVFVPTVPTPTIGNLYVIPDNRVFTIDVPLLDLVKFISRWGEASPQLSEAIKQINTDKKS